MLIGSFLKNTKKEFRNRYFSGLSFNSADCKKDYIFFAIKGNNFDGNNYIQEAIEKGAKVVVSEKKINFQNKDVIYLKCKNPRKLLAELSYKFINNVSWKLHKKTR